MVRSMLVSRHVPQEFWPEAVLWSVHVLNRCPTYDLRNKTPKEAWSGKKSFVDYFRIFGCIAFAEVPYKLRNKLDDRSVKNIFLGQSDKSKAYKLYNPATPKVTKSRDAVFDE